MQVKGLIQRGLLLATIGAAALPAGAAAQSITLEGPDPDCRVLSPAARMIDSGQLRVCQSEWAVTGAYLGGHLALPLAEATAALQLTLPDSGLPLFTGDAELVPVVAADPFAGVSRYSAGAGDATYFQITETARVAPGAQGYTLTYAIKNVTGTPLKIRPIADLNGYGEGAPVLSTTAAPRTLTIASPVSGGLVRLREGAPAAAGYTGGSWDELEYGPTLDNTLHPTRTGRDTGVALAWAPVTIAAGATASYSVAIDVAQPRELLLDLLPGQLVSDPIVRFAARVTDERVTAGSVVRWTLGNAPGSAPVAADGTGQLPIEVPVGTNDLIAWFDADNDGARDADEPSTQGSIQLPFRYTPPPAPTPPAWNPLPPSAPQPAPMVTVPFKATYKVKGCARKTVKLRLKDGKKVLATRSVKLDKRCRVSTTFRISMAQFRGKDKLRVDLTFRGKTKRFKV